MKLKLIWIGFLAFPALCASAQTQRGTGYASLGVSFGTSRQNSSTAALNNFTFSPKISYLPVRDLALGLEFPVNLSRLRGASYRYYDDQSNTYQSTFGAKELSFGISPSIRKYIPVQKNIYFFGQLNLLVQVNSSKIISEDGYLIRTDNKLKGIGANLSPGFAFFTSPTLSLELSFPIISFFHQSYFDVDSMYNSDQTNTLRLALDNFSPCFTVNVHF